MMLFEAFADAGEGFPAVIPKKEKGSHDSRDPSAPKPKRDRGSRRRKNSQTQSSKLNAQLPAQHGRQAEQARAEQHERSRLRSAAKLLRIDYTFQVEPR